MRGAEEVLYETETSLRLVDHVLGDLEALGVDLGRDGGETDGGSEEAPSPVIEITPVRVFREVQEGLRSLRRSRAILEQTSEAKNDGLAVDGELPYATDALGGLDHALDLLARCDGDPEGPQRASMLQAVRAEIVRAMTSLRLHDVTEQQLSYACSVLLDTERWLDDLSRQLDPQAAESPGARLMASR